MRKPPKHVYSHSITLHVAQGVDVWQEVASADIAIEGVNVQPSSATVRNKDNTEVTLRAMLFADSRYTSPALDWWALKEQSETNGSLLTLTFEGNTFHVISVDKLYNEYGQLDHWEVGLI